MTLGTLLSRDCDMIVPMYEYSFYHVITYMRDRHCRLINTHKLLLVLSVRGSLDYCLIPLIIRLLQREEFIYRSSVRDYLYEYINATILYDVK